MSETTGFKDSLKNNRSILLAILMLPVLGMVISIPLIIWKAPKNMGVAVGIIVLLMAQYALLVWWISKKIDQLIEG